MLKCSRRTAEMLWMLRMCYIHNVCHYNGWYHVLWYVTRKPSLFCFAVDVIKASLFGLLSAHSEVCSERFHSHIFSSISTVCDLSDKAGWIHNALAKKFHLKEENGIECHSITARGKHGNTQTQKAFTLTYTKQQYFSAFPCNICTALECFSVGAFQE